VAASGASILVVEDDAALRMLCRVNLELEGFRVREASRLAEARTEVEVERPALVFLDLHVGDEGASDDLLEELLADGIPVVLVSGTVDMTSYQGRATALLPKPFDPADLVALARRHADMLG
jgi:two-component system OmpR family response regulator